eukprot:12823138-Prorocentrum_lima.AAC.1
MQSRLKHERDNVAQLQSELHQVKSQRPVSPRDLDARIRILLENRVQATHVEEQTQIGKSKQEGITA